MSGENMNTRHRRDDPPVKITREVPLQWLIGGCVAVIVQAVTLWIGQQNQGQAIRELLIEVRQLRAAAEMDGRKTVENGVMLRDHERRIGLIEARQQVK